jgi:hypothetical protein
VTPEEKEVLQDKDDDLDDDLGAPALFSSAKLTRETWWFDFRVEEAGHEAPVDKVEFASVLEP